jgi:hypothetical protein
MVSRKAKVGIVIVVIIVGLVGAAAYYSSRQSSTPALFAGAGAPTDQDIETQISQQGATSNPTVDRNWNGILNACMNLYRLGDNLFESDCDGRAMTGDRDYDCRVWNGELLICDQNSALGKKFQSYLNVIGFTSTE